MTTETVSSETASRGHMTGPPRRKTWSIGGAQNRAVSATRKEMG